MSKDKTPDAAPKLYYDGDCPMCQAFVAGIKDEKDGQSITLEDARSAQLPSGVNRDSALHEIHLQDSDGKILRNSAAIVRVLELRGWPPILIFLMRLPGIRHLAVLVYRIIAANRMRLFRPKKKSA